MSDMMTSEQCHCGQALHYQDQAIEAMVRKFIAQFGEYIPVTVGRRTWLVQRHFIALHGLKAQDLPGLGFQEITHWTTAGGVRP